MEVNGIPHLLVISEPQQTLPDDVLKIGLPDVDDVVHALSMPKLRVGIHAGTGCRDPDAGIFESAVVEVLLEESQFPKLVCDVFADICYGPVGSHDDLVIVVAFRVDSHDPAAAVLSFGLKENRVLLLELLKRTVPEFQMKDVALAGQQVITHANT